MLAASVVYGQVHSLDSNFMSKTFTSMRIFWTGNRLPYSWAPRHHPYVD